MKRVIRTVFVALAWGLAGAGGALAADKGPVIILVKPGATLASRAADTADCNTIASKDDRGYIISSGLSAASSFAPQFNGSNQAQVVLGGIIAGAMNELNGLRAHTRVCMINKGYAELSLTEAEQKARGSGGGADKWEAAFLTDPAAAPRIAEAARVKVPQFPAYRDDLSVFGGLRLLPDTFVPTPQPIREGVAVRGKAVRNRTALVKEGFEVREGELLLKAAAGTRLFHVDNRHGLGPMLEFRGTTWCGPLEESWRGGAAKTRLYCIASRPWGYQIFTAPGQLWMAAGGARQLANMGPPITTTTPILLDAQADDPLGQMDVVITLISADINWYKFSYEVSHDGQAVVFPELWLDPKRGAASFHMGDQKILFQRSGGYVTTSRVAGEGKGWRANYSYILPYDWRWSGAR